MIPQFLTINITLNIEYNIDYWRINGGELILDEGGGKGDKDIACR